MAWLGGISSPSASRNASRCSVVSTFMAWWSRLLLLSDQRGDLRRYVERFRIHRVEGDVRDGHYRFEAQHLLPAHRGCEHAAERLVFGDAGGHRHGPHVRDRK